MLFDVCSDLHVDLFASGIDSVDFHALKNTGSDVLVIAGDVSNHFYLSRRVLDRACKEYKHVVFVDGNHETYEMGDDISDAELEMHDYCRSEANLTYLPRDDYKIGGTVFIGTNGWYDWSIMCPLYSKAAQFDAWKRMSNDRFLFSEIPIDERAFRAAEDLRNRVAKLDADELVTEIVIVTHTVPLVTLLEHRTHDSEYQKLSGSYGNSNMSAILGSKKIKAWVYGHTHNRKLVVYSGVQFVNNARGYEFEETGKWWMVQMNSAEEDLRF